MNQITGDQSLLKRINRMALVGLVKAQPGVSRADLAKHTGLTKSTVSILVKGLIHEGWLCERAVPAAGGVGRRPTPLSIDPDRLALLGAEIGVDYLNVVGCNLQGDLLWSRMVPYRHAAVGESLERLAGMVARAHQRLANQGRTPLGLGVGLPGLVDATNGVLRFAPNIGWRDIPVREQMAVALARAGCGDMNVDVLNEANAAALSEYIFGSENHTAPLVYISIGVGLGAGIVLGDRLYVGNDGLAGEVGHTVLQLDGPPCLCGRRGCAETYISQRAVSRAITGETGEILSIKELVDRVVRHDPAAVKAAEQAGQYLGLLMQNLSNTINPAVMVLGGPLCQLGSIFVDAALASMKRQAGTADYHRTTVRLCRFGINACAVGAAGGVLIHYLHPLAQSTRDV